MNATRVLRAGHYQPMIKFIGKHLPPANVSHVPHAHPEAPTETLPDSFATYRSKAQSHGPLGGRAASAPPTMPASTPHGVSASHGSYAGHAHFAHGAIGAHSGRELGAIAPAPGSGVAMDRSQLPKRFGRLQLTESEMEAVESGGATLS